MSVAYFFHFFSAGAFWSDSHLKCNRISFIQTFETCTHYTAMMDENILSTVIYFNEAEAFLIVKPFYCPFKYSFALR